MNSALAALDQITTWASDVDHSSYTTASTAGVGAQRRVQIKRMALIETVTVWEPEQELAYSLDGLPIPDPSVTNCWRLEPTAGGTLVTLTSSIDPGSTAKGRVGARILAVVLGRASGRLVSGFAAQPWAGA